MFIVHYLSISVPFFFGVGGGRRELDNVNQENRVFWFWSICIRYKRLETNYLIFFTQLLLYVICLQNQIMVAFYIYIYIYTPVYKNIAISKYISYICKNTEERLKQRGHTLHQPRGVTITYNICFWQKILKIQAQKRNNYIYDIQVLN